MGEGWRTNSCAMVGKNPYGLRFFAVSVGLNTEPTLGQFAQRNRANLFRHDLD
jgi:hypothetical protein